MSSRRHLAAATTKKEMTLRDEKIMPCLSSWAELIIMQQQRQQQQQQQQIQGQHQQQRQQQQQRQLQHRENCSRQDNKSSLCRLSAMADIGYAEFSIGQMALKYFTIFNQKSVIQDWSIQLKWSNILSCLVRSPKFKVADNHPES